MKKPIIRIHDLELNEIIDREMNDEEFSKYELEQEKLLKEKEEAEAKIQAEKEEAEAKAKAKAEAEAKLEKLGLTTDDLRALGL